MIVIERRIPLLRRRENGFAYESGAVSLSRRHNAP